jgi:YD repeat-containing protein
LLATVIDGYGVRAEFVYAPLTRPDVHVASGGAGYPVIHFVAPDYAVSRLVRSDGIGGTYSEMRTYEGAKLDLRGRGFLGFARQRVTDSRSGLVTIEDRLQDPSAYDRIGALAAVTVQQPNGPIVSRVRFSWASLPFGSAGESRSFPYVSTSTAERYELDGALVSSTSVYSRVDSFGAVTYRNSTTTEGSTGLNPGATHTERLTVDSVTNDASRWCLGRPGTITVTRFHSLAGGTPLTRSFTQSIDPTLCRVTQRVDEPGNPDLRVTTDLGYDSFGNLVARTASAAGQSLRTRRFDWSNSGRFLAARIDEEGQRTTAYWDPVQGLPMSLTDPNGLVTMWQYDSFRRLTRETRPDGTFTETTRGTCGANCLAPTAVRFVTSSEQAFGGLPIRSSTVGFDTFDREVYRQFEQPGGSVLTVSRYSNRGLLAQRSVPSLCCGTPAFWTSYSYDLLGRPIRLERPASGADPSPVAMRWQYAGLTTSLIDALGRATVKRHDARGNVIQTVDPGNADTDFEYDAFSNLVKVRDFRGNETAMTYDGRGQRTSISDVDSGLRTFRYTPFGELQSETNARGQTVTLAYDRLSRRISRQEPEGATYWTWGNSATLRNMGSLAGVSSPGFQETFEYDSLGRPSARIATAFGATFATRFAYDPAPACWTRSRIRPCLVRRCESVSTTTVGGWRESPTPMILRRRSGNSARWTHAGR